MKRSLGPLTLSALLLAGCATTSSPTSSAPPEPAETPAPEPVEEATTAPQLQRIEVDPDDPEWFDKLAAREVELGPEQPVEAPDGSFRGRVRGVVDALQSPEEGTHYFQVGMGTTAPAQCWVYTVPVDMATALGNLSLLVRDGTMFGSPFEDYAVDHLETDVRDGLPYLRLRWGYLARLGEGDDLVRGTVDQVILETADGGYLYCLHNEPGYHRAFLDMALGLGRSLEIPELAAEAEARFLHEIHRIRIDEIDIGLSMETYRLEEDGSVEILSETLTIIPLSEKDLIYQDEYGLESSTTDGRLLFSLVVTQEDGEVNTHLELAPTDDGTWSVSGEFEGKELEETFEAEEIVSNWGLRLALRAMGRGESDRVELPLWAQDVDPLGVTPFTFTATGPPDDAEGRPVTYVALDRTVESLINRDGLPRRIESDLAGRSFVLELIHAEGSSEDGPDPTAETP